MALIIKTRNSAPIISNINYIYNKFYVFCELSTKKYLSYPGVKVTPVYLTSFSGFVLFPS